MNLLYLTFGQRTEVHSQAAFSILSFLAAGEKVDTINVITDHPAFYKHLLHKVTVLSVSPEELKEWEGTYKFFWRVKIKAIEKICAMYPDSPVVYLDSDTLLAGSLTPMQNVLLQGKALMHENEGPLSHKKSKTEKKMWRQIKQQSFGGIVMQPTNCIWNAGVVATPNIHQNKECTLALSICDEMCQKGVTPRLIEQYALSLAFEKVYGLQDAKETIAHYWSVKDSWNRLITSFFLEAHFCQWTPQETIMKAKELDVSKTPIAMHTRNTNARLKKWVDKTFPSKNPVYLQPKEY
jgi:hypothetical protein